MAKNQIVYSIRTVDNKDYTLTTEATQLNLYDNYNFDFPITADHGFRLNPACIVYIRNISKN